MNIHYILGTVFYWSFIEVYSPNKSFFLLYPCIWKTHTEAIHTLIYESNIVHNLAEAEAYSSTFLLLFSFQQLHKGLNMFICISWIWWHCLRESSWLSAWLAYENPQIPRGPKVEWSSGMMLVWDPELPVWTVPPVQLKHWAVGYILTQGTRKDPSAGALGLSLWVICE